MPKVLVLFAHPGQRHSVANRTMVRALEGLDGVTFVDLYARYPRMKIDVDHEQEQLLAHDILVLQFPLMWYSTPSLLKEWQDLVLEYGFAYGEGGTALEGKAMMVATTVGGPEEAYGKTGHKRFTLREFLRPLELTAELCLMRFLPPLALFGALQSREEGRLESHANGYRTLLSGLASGAISPQDLEGHEMLSAGVIDNLQEGTA